MKIKSIILFWILFIPFIVSADPDNTKPNANEYVITTHDPVASVWKSIKLQTVLPGSQLDVKINADMDTAINKMKKLSIDFDGRHINVPKEYLNQFDTPDLSSLLVTSTDVSIDDPYFSIYLDFKVGIHRYQGKLIIDNVRITIAKNNIKDIEILTEDGELRKSIFSSKN